MKVLKFIGKLILLIIDCIFTLIGTLFGISFLMDLFDKK